VTKRESGPLRFSGGLGSPYQAGACPLQPRSQHDRPPRSATNEPDRSMPRTPASTNRRHSAASGRGSSDRSSRARRGLSAVLLHIVDSGAHESACQRARYRCSRCRRLPADTAPLRVLDWPKGIARLGWAGRSRSRPSGRATSAPADRSYVAIGMARAAAGPASPFVANRSSASAPLGASSVAKAVARRESTGGLRRSSGPQAGGG
jgi:hypothetical protein